jgi:hypothetical protein
MAGSVAFLTAWRSREKQDNVHIFQAFATQPAKVSLDYSSHIY